MSKAECVTKVIRVRIVFVNKQVKVILTKYNVETNVDGFFCYLAFTKQHESSRCCLAVKFVSCTY